MTDKPKERRAPKKKRIPAPGLSSLTELLTHLKINTWDTLIIGDGSGTGWKQGAGWASVLIDKYSAARKLFYGAMNTGTITLGELYPYLHAMTWYTDKQGPARRRKRELQAVGRQMQIHMVTDSQVVATSGNRPESRKSHKAIWAAFDVYRQNGYAITFHYVERDRINLNVLVDEVARQSRLDVLDTFNKAIKTLGTKYPGLPDDVTIYDFST